VSDVRTQDFFHRYASDFDAIYGSGTGPLQAVINRLFRRSMKLRFLKTLDGCQPIEGMTVLDVGCGPGHYSISLAARGARRVVGLDFAGGMLDLARRHAAEAGLAERCEFVTGDFLTFSHAEKFDYVIVMGFMDYREDARGVVAKVLSLTRHKAFFSFPAAGGLLAWQRKLRYRNRCPLYLYSREQLESLCASFPEARAAIEPIARDFFVTMSVKPA
jgi:SAM-dependent methyltransferase